MIRLVDLLEPVFGRWILVDIRVVLAGQRAERLLDLIGGRVPRHPEDFVVVAGHPTHSSRRLTTTAAGRSWLEPCPARAQHLDNRPGCAVAVLDHTNHLVTLRVERHP